MFHILHLIYTFRFDISDIILCKYQQGSLYELPVPNQTVDCIVGVMIAQFIDIPLFFEEAKRVLKPGGVLLFHGKDSPRVAEIQRETECKSESETNTTAKELNQRFVDTKTKLFSGLFHDRAHFNPLRYRNIPPLHPGLEASRKEWSSSCWSTVPELADYMLTYSAAGKYCVKHGITTHQLREKLIGMLSCGEEVGRFRLQADRFTWCSANKESS